MGKTTQSFLQRIWGYFGTEPENIKPDKVQSQPDQWSDHQEKPPYYNTARRKKSPTIQVRKLALERKPLATLHEIATESPLRTLAPNVSFGDTVKYYRRQNKWSVSGFVKRLEIDNLPLRFIRSVEEYGYIPDPKTVERMAYVLGAPRKDMLQAAYRQLLEEKTYPE